jgi:hypothetical protein
MTLTYPRVSFTSFAAFVLLIASEGTNLRASDCDDQPASEPAKPLTEKDYSDFAKNLEEAATKGEKASFDNLIRIMELLERSISDLGLSETDLKLLLEGAKSAKYGFAEQIIAEVKRGGRYSLLRRRELDGRKSVLMRLILEDGSVNYHEFLLHRSSDGQVVAEDVYIYLSCEKLSRTFRNMMLVFLADSKKGFVAKLKEADQVYLKNVNDVIELTSAAQSGKNAKALSIFRKLPPELQKEKSLQLLAIKAAQEGEESEYLVELERFRKAHPKDVAIDFLSIDYYVLKKQYGEAQKSIEKLDKAVGGDPFLQILKGGMLNQAGKSAEAKWIIEKALEDDSKLILGYWARIGIAVEEKNHGDTLTWLKKVEETGLVKVSPDNIKSSELYAEFVKSPEFEKLKSWLAERKR